MYRVLEIDGVPILHPLIDPVHRTCIRPFWNMRHAGPLTEQVIQVGEGGDIIQVVDDEGTWSISGT